MTTGMKWGVVAAAAFVANVEILPAQQGVFEDLGEGWTAFQVATREGVQICDWGSWSGRRGRSDAGEHCVEGGVTVLLRVSGEGQVVDVKHRALGSSRGPSADADLGRISTGESARFLLTLVPDGPGDVGEDALAVAAMVDSVTIWPDLERFATDRGLRQDVRKAALFWLGQAAADEATRGITEVLDASDETVGIKEAAVFALSQRPDSVAVPLLMEIAEGADHPEVRRSALFWLSQHDDPRVISFFREILSGE